MSQPGSGIVYERVESPRNAIFDSIKQQPFFTLSQDFARAPHKPRGAPGVALLDYDGDGDLDIYVTNGPGAANSLLSNRLMEDGEIGFEDVAVAAGVDATEQDSTGVCFGDIDNDGDHDLMVLGAIEPNRLFENRGDGTFEDITVDAGIGGGNLSTASCAMGDADNDGLLDIAVANTHTDWSNLLALVVPFVFTEHNQLYMNRGANVFEEVGLEAGIRTLEGFPMEGTGAAGLTWVISMVDMDLDGDVDIFTADDQGAVTLPRYGGFNYGIFHYFVNDGNGRFTDAAVSSNLTYSGSWMGLSFGDFNCDDRMDFFSTNLGDYTGSTLRVGRPSGLGDLPSQWFLQEEDGTFSNPGQGDMVASVFGWGTSAFDYDNDGDTDIVYYGGFEPGWFIDATNPGVMMQNQDCTANFTYDGEAFAESVSHTRRNLQGSAVGDLNRDGFVDIVSVSNFDIPEEIELKPNPAQWGGPLDATAFYVETFAPTFNPERFVWNGLEMANGSLAIELASADNGNRWIEVTLLGTSGLTSRGRVNRDGIGAVVSFRTPEGKRQMAPVLGGSSYASQDSLAANFGLGGERRGLVEVLWPGGVRNRLYTVRTGERVLFPEIPCSYDGDWRSPREYLSCVNDALLDLSGAGIITVENHVRFLVSAIRAYFSFHGG